MEYVILVESSPAAFGLKYVINSRSFRWRDRGPTDRFRAENDQSAFVQRSRQAAVRSGYPEGLFSGHSLRAGFLTEAGRQNADLLKMREHSRHASIEMFAGYVRDHERFREHAGEGFLGQGTRQQRFPHTTCLAVGSG